MTEEAPAPDGGNREAFDRIYERVYAELRRFAHGMRRDVPAESGSLVHEAYLKLFESDIHWEDRSHFIAMAATAMRQVLVDRARKEFAKKRGGGKAPVCLDSVEIPQARQPEEILEVNAALRRLKKMDRRLARVVEFRYFLGLEEDEIAELLGVAPRTVRRDWQKAKSFLLQELGSAEAEGSSPAE
jgi:RNA polymerase sigma factor (TIGR02999 family)